MNYLSPANGEPFRQLTFHGVRAVNVRYAKLIASVLAAFFSGFASGVSTQAVAGVIQEAATVFDCCGAPTVADFDQIFKLTGAEINADISAHIGGTSGAGYTATAGAGRFGQVGLDVGLFRSLSGQTLRASVLIASDEFVNLSAHPVRARTQFIIDGGEFFMPFSTETEIGFLLEVGAQNRGIQGPITEHSDMSIVGNHVATSGGEGLPEFTGGSYRMALSSDVKGALSFSTSSVRGLDLHAALNGPTRVSIPLSLQTLDLGVLAAGERLLIGYRASIQIDQDGFSEGETGRFSDPVTLLGNSILSNVTFTPAPEASVLTMLLTGFLGLCALKRRRQSAITPHATAGK